MKINEQENFDNYNDYESSHFIKIANESDTSSKRFLQKKRCEKDSKMKKKEDVMRENLIEGINTPMNSNNKGYKMLVKMGYKQGRSLGKNEQGIKEPIQISENDLLKIKKNIGLSNGRNISKQFERNENTYIYGRALNLNQIMNLREKVLYKINTLMNIEESMNDKTGKYLKEFEVCFEQCNNENSFMKSHLFQSLISSDHFRVKISQLDEFIKVLNRNYLKTILSYNKGNTRTTEIGYLNDLDKFFKAVSSLLKQFSIEELNFCLTCGNFFPNENKIDHIICDDNQNDLNFEEEE